MKTQKQFVPRNISEPLTETLYTITKELYPTQFEHLVQTGWRLYVVHQTCGACYHEQKVITIPVWAMQHKDPTYTHWYIAHEIAHVYAGAKAKHGPKFMCHLKLICPQNAIYHELSYKPRNAKSAGIRMPDDILDVLGF